MNGDEKTIFERFEKKLDNMREDITNIMIDNREHKVRGQELAEKIKNLPCDTHQRKIEGITNIATENATTIKNTKTFGKWCIGIFGGAGGISGIIIIIKIAIKFLDK